MGGGYTPNRATTPEPQSSWAAPVETPSYAPSAPAAAPAGGMKYQMGGGYTPASRTATPTTASAAEAPSYAPSASAAPAPPAGGKKYQMGGGYTPNRAAAPAAPTYALHPTPHTIHHTPHTIHQTPHTRNPKRETPKQVLLRRPGARLHHRVRPAPPRRSTSTLSTQPSTLIPS